MLHPSTRNLDALPDPATLERLCQALAVLDAVVCPEWELRYHSFNQAWDAALGQRLGSWRNGSGDEWFAVFQDGGVFLRGFAHEKRSRNAPGLFDGVPELFQPLLSEPAFGDDTTFCCWNTGSGWKRGTTELAAAGDPDGSAELLALLVDDPVAWKSFAMDYHEREVPLAAIGRVLSGEPLTAELLAALDPESTLAALAADLEEIGWPVA